ncbi:tail fiber assembly protein [Citrobacter sp. Cs237]|uniref:tail fiber assembly protein n=1 Tax=Citrobacter sp. Cs237 TaxID=2985156 RepID=UPI0025776BE8|nr:tail fiber assembly protein [Citrobacter sp. Cs237]MDM2751413.1 tail fiber assembly protein [Citrobacter sp. Cs237]
MKYAFSAISNAFYPLELKSSYEDAGSWPVDGVGVDETVFATYTGTPPPGKMRGSDENGYPIWVSTPPLTHEQQIAVAENEKASRIDETNSYINSKQWPGKASIGRLKGDELAQYNLWLDYLDELDAVDTSTAPNITWPEPPIK